MGRERGGSRLHRVQHPMESGRQHPAPAEKGPGRAGWGTLHPGHFPAAASTPAAPAPKPCMAPGVRKHPCVALWCSMGLGSCWS